ncbi:Monothiol glutaredoxin-4 [Hyphodiscus hymeniophilus]|uniref:Monothiol glutaredoxin-4 n=1 Tax=Hyphodiscus hymeniophilus TaxID=353542 RepID=A0A9P6VH12_9HELO|nr:Monothiol glutaredoxin-4 [Hyphodiscus hymeniophilus]
MSTLVELTTEEEWKNHVASLPPTTLQVIYFFADWAAPCKNMTTVLQTLASSFPVTEPLSTSWVSMNAEEVVDVSDAFDVTAVPYLILTRNNQVLETVSGSDATKVRTAIEKHAKSSGGAVNGANTNTNGTAKNLSSYAPAPNDPATAPQYSSAETKQNKEDLQERLTKLVKAAPVMLFMKGTPSAPQCGFSRQLVALLRENSVKYGFFNILADDEVRQGLKEFADWPTFPQLWVDGELVGGLDIVKEEMSNDPEFLKPYSVAKTTGGPAAASQQVDPASATA